MKLISIIILILSVLKLKHTESKCIDSFAIICDSVADIAQYGRKQWTSLIIQNNENSNSVNREELRVKTLEKCSNLEDLYIINKLEWIDVSAFQILTNIEYINLYKNEIKHLAQGMFSNLPKLYKLELQQNNIQTIARIGFEKTPKLSSLNLANNRLEEINKEMFKNIQKLKKLNLSTNILSDIEPESFPSNLEILDLSNNQLRFIEEKTFSNLNNLEELILSRNILKKIPKYTFQGLNAIFRLDLSYNIIDTIEIKAFDDLLKMKILHLGHNKLKFLKPDVFPKNNTLTTLTLQSLRLDHNKLTYLNEEAIFQRLISLHTISIGGNPWQCVCLQEIQTEMNKRNVVYTNCDRKHYFNGTNPTCMQFRTDECVKNTEFVGLDWPQLYFNALGDYSYDCP